MADKKIDIGFDNNRRVINIEGQREGPILDQEISIKLRPRLIIKSLLILAFLLIIFFAGRWSIDAPDFSLPDLHVSGILSTTTKANTNTTSKTEVKVEAAKPIETKTVNQTPTAAVAAKTEEPAAPAKVEAVNTSTSATTESTSTADGTDFSGKYTKVALSIGNVKFDWKSSWGKITQLEYTIKNNEDGTIHPDHVNMIVEGYTDENAKKVVPLPNSAKKILPNQALSSAVNIPTGFAYSESTAGRLDSVNINFILFDSKNQMMTSYSKEYNIGGTPTPANSS